MGAITRPLNMFFVVPFPAGMFDSVTAWFENNADLCNGMVLLPGEARFTDGQWADAFADEIGSCWDET